MEQNISIQEYYRIILFIPTKKYIKDFSDTTSIYLLKSTGMPEEITENI